MLHEIHGRIVYLPSDTLQNNLQVFVEKIQEHAVGPVTFERTETEIIFEFRLLFFNNLFTRQFLRHLQRTSQGQVSPATVRIFVPIINKWHSVTFSCRKTTNVEDNWELTHEVVEAIKDKFLTIEQQAVIFTEIAANFGFDRAAGLLRTGL